MCHNTNVLEANNCIVNSGNLGRIDSKIADYINDAFKKHGIPMTERHSFWSSKVVEDYSVAVQLYAAWASYAKGSRTGEKYVCDSDNGPVDLKKILSSVEYSAGTLDLVVTLNKALDVVHFRSDLAAAFIEGG